MGGRFGKYGDLKRRKALQRSRKEKSGIYRTRYQALRQNGRSIHSTQRASMGVAVKTHKSAVVAIPPRNLWGPIQGLRRQYDCHFRRWMPHITLLYPFHPGTDLHQLIPVIARVCRNVEPFEVRLIRFDLFARNRRNATLFLIPKPVVAFKAVHNNLNVFAVTLKRERSDIRWPKRHFITMKQKGTAAARTPNHPTPRAQR